ncbi:lysophospholipase [Leptolyngbya sp. NK1-12]|uniref:Lysophospholipase n=1 Tax=Leptolyngbya sp. NK1-12 TaxID=2547451 RepID=A0AA97APR8_9CYAN|nr:lysophospholipase [Leptolyngbya sp. NK1-12]
MSSQAPEFILFVQHGWADDNRAMLNLASQLAANNALIVAPDLGFIQTWLRIEPLIQMVEKVAFQQLQTYPEVPLRIVGHSMGGLIWIELLHRHRSWWPRVHSLVLVGSPVGGADLGRILDPFGIGLGIAADLGCNRKPMATEIAAVIPTLAIAGDIDGGSDGTVTVNCTRFAYVHYVSIPESHAALRDHPAVAALIRNFWDDFTIGESIEVNEIIHKLSAVPGMTDGHPRDFKRAEVVMYLKDGSSIRTWVNPFGVDHVFVASPDGQCLYAGFVGWVHAQDLQQALHEIRLAYGIW